MIDHIDRLKHLFDITRAGKQRWSWRWTNAAFGRGHGRVLWNVHHKGNVKPSLLCSSMA